MPIIIRQKMVAAIILISGESPEIERQPVVRIMIVNWIPYIYVSGFENAD